ncbi:MAG TPA: hypothetical protein VNZ22_14090 [Bacillota bacterium]|nr:hypothetical protein [Bacillota bacterium]
MYRLISNARWRGALAARGWRHLAGWLALTTLLAGCTGHIPRPVDFRSEYHPENVFLWSSALPSSLKRVALLPLVTDTGSVDLVEGRAALEPILRTELVKTKRFEIFPLSPECLRTRTGQVSWSGEEPLPPEFFAWLRETTGCDAVLFCRLTTFRAYAPLAVGWRLRLVDLHTRTTLWAADEVFDAGRPSVQAGARHYQQAEAHPSIACPDEWSINHSPRQFGQYTAAQLLATLPNP